MLVHLRDHRVPDKNTIRSIDDFEIYVSFKEESSCFRMYDQITHGCKDTPAFRLLWQPYTVCTVSHLLIYIHCTSPLLPYSAPCLSFSLYPPHWGYEQRNDCIIIIISIICRSILSWRSHRLCYFTQHRRHSLLDWIELDHLHGSDTT